MTRVDLHVHEYCRMDGGDMSLYGVFDGHEGSRVANFAAQRMPAELLLGQMKVDADDEEIKEILNQVTCLFMNR